MANILGLDLGTNSIGWAIRDTDSENDNQIIDYGVVIFEKGVGNNKSGEFSLAAERRKNRSKRRLYNAKRYRKWELLKILIENEMCPLTQEELKLWSIGNWETVDGKMKNKGRVYPINNIAFQQWLAFDPSYFGTKGTSENGKPIRKNPYDLRFELIEKEQQNEFIQKQKIGRALYHLVQRRGFKSSRKSGKSTYAENAELEERKSQNANFHIVTLAKEKLDKGERFRASGVIQRRYFEDEFFAICNAQKINNTLIEKLYKAIYFVRPLRSQKGLVGNCTLEKGKPRIPLSHPKFEEFRALSFINNIKWRENGNQTFESIPISLKKKILEELFFRKLERGSNKGKINTDSYFKFDDIIDKYSENGKYEFNYKNKPNVSTCPTIASLMNVFDAEWENKFIEDENNYGINWKGLNIEYTLKYGKLKRTIREGEKVYVQKNAADKRILKVNEIWHLLFDYIQTKDKPENLEIFCKNVLGFNNEKAKEFSGIDIPQGYGSLSYNAISKILPFLQNGYIYSEAVSFANLKKVLADKFETGKDKAKEIIANAIDEIDAVKENLNIVNGLIQQYFATNETNRAKGVDNHIKEMAYQDSSDKLKKYFGEADWNKKSESEQKRYSEEILNLYLKFLDGKQAKEEKASSRLDKNPEIDYYKLPRLDENIKAKLKIAFNLSDDKLKQLYHPSDIEMYPKSKSWANVRIDGIEQWVKLLESPQPPSKGWKNPMAMRTLHELRHLLNYLLRVGKIDSNTKVVVEMARELNDANKRWAIQTYQRYREEENKEFAKAIVGVAKEKYPNLNENDIENINKVRLWWEQIENNEEIFKQIKALKEDIEKYRLWKEQECQCIYTGNPINLTDLFDGTKTDFEHTLPASDSFDNSLSNLTVCDSFYNREIKKDKIPTHCQNYNTDYGHINGKTYTAIEPRLKKWKEKVKHLKSLIDENKKRTKKTQDPETKKGLIQKRHLLQFEYDYWNKKLETFTVTEIPNKWKNSQLIDTQIISKYARFYLKTVFDRVDVIKAKQTFNEIEDGMINIFKKIYQLKGDEQKDRSKHSHHATDAAVLTLIPNSAKREAMLKEYYTAIENKRKFSTKPYDKFETNHVLNIETDIAINQIQRDNVIIKTKKLIRKRGEVVFLRNPKTQKYILDENNNRIAKKATGDTIRGQINEESYLGAIIPPLYEDSKAAKEDGSWKIRKDKNGNPEIWIVKRIPISDVNFEKDIIIDEQLKSYLTKQLNEEKKPVNELLDFNGNKIRHLRCRVKTGKGFQSREKTIELKKHSHQSNKEYKQNVLSKIADNYLCLFYQNKQEIEKRVRVVSLFDFSDLGFSSLKDIWVNEEWSTYKTETQSISLRKIIKPGTKALFFSKGSEDLKQLDLPELKRRLFIVYKFNESYDKRTEKYYYAVYFKNHIDARPNPEIDKECEDRFDGKKYQSGLCLKPENMNCLFEGINFEQQPDGKIIWRI